METGGGNARVAQPTFDHALNKHVSQGHHHARGMVQAHMSSQYREVSVGLLDIETVADAQGYYQEGSLSLLENSTVALEE
jgi:hypothetical protein